MARKAMTGKALVFVAGHRRPAVAPLDAAYTRRHPDGTPIRALSTADTLDRAMARHEAATTGAARAGAATAGAATTGGTGTSIRRSAA